MRWSVKKILYDNEWDCCWSSLKIRVQVCASCWDFLFFFIMDPFFMKLKGCYYHIATYYHAHIPRGYWSIQIHPWKQMMMMMMMIHMEKRRIKRLSIIINNESFHVMLLIMFMMMMMMMLDKLFSFFLHFKWWWEPCAFQYMWMRLRK